MVTTAAPFRDDDSVTMAVKTPMMPRPTTARLPSRLNLRESVQQLVSESPKDPHASRVIAQLAREMRNTHHYLAVCPSGIKQVDPEKTSLADIAIPREIHTDAGPDLEHVATVEIQQYARVGA